VKNRFTKSIWKRDSKRLTNDTGKEGIPLIQNLIFFEKQIEGKKNSMKD